MAAFTDLTTFELVLTCWVLVLTMTLCVLLIAFRNWMRRYERFRHECGVVFSEQRVRIEDHETRLRRLGSGDLRRPPEMNSDEVWARRSS